VTPFAEQRKLFGNTSFPKALQVKIQNVHSLGPATRDVKQLSKLKALDLLHTRYQKYLRGYLPVLTEAYGMHEFLRKTGLYDAYKDQANDLIHRPEQDAVLF
jgi:hypothetical protein